MLHIVIEPYTTKSCNSALTFSIVVIRKPFTNKQPLTYKLLSTTKFPSTCAAGPSTLLYAKQLLFVVPNITTPLTKALLQKVTLLFTTKSDILVS